MDVFKTMAFVYEGRHELLDTIQHEGKWWLVATYLQHPTTLHKVPERIIQLGSPKMPYQELPAGGSSRFLLNKSLPISVLDGEAQDGYVIAIHPDALLKTQGPTTIQ